MAANVVVAVAWNMPAPTDVADVVVLSLRLIASPVDSVFTKVEPVSEKSEFLAVPVVDLTISDVTAEIVTPPLFPTENFSVPFCWRARSAPVPCWFITTAVAAELSKTES